jgi:coiled-coil domain-containing protein 130
MKTETASVNPKLSSKARVAAEVERRKKALQQEVRDNSRAAADPFLAFGSTDSTRKFRAIAGIKRKAQSDGSEPKEPEEKEGSDQPQPTSALSLVAYDSD